MIWHSYGWKQDLLKTATKLSKRIHQKRWTERSYFLFEKDIFFAFYSIRKLIECQKLSDYIVEKKIPLECFKNTELPVTLSTIISSRFDIDEHYDLQNPSSELINIKKLCDQFIHSYIFIPCFGDFGKLDGIIFCSDYTRKNKVYKLAIDDLIEILSIVGSDNISSRLMSWDEKGNCSFVNISKDDPNLNARLRKFDILP